MILPIRAFFYENLYERLPMSFSVSDIIYSKTQNPYSTKALQSDFPLHPQYIRILSIAPFIFAMTDLLFWFLIKTAEIITIYFNPICR